MWHGTYVDWLEEARIEALSKVGMNYEKISAEGYELPVISLLVNYKIAIKHGEQIIMETICLPIEGIRLKWKTFFRKTNGKIAADASIELVFVKMVNGDPSLLKVIPEHILLYLKLLSSGPAS